MKILKNLFLFLGIVILSYFLGGIVGVLYARLLGSTADSGLFGLYGQLAQFLFGVALSYIFFLTLIFTAFGGAKKYWWIGILLIPAAAFELYFDLAHFYFPLALGLFGWGIGLGISKLMKK